MSQSDQHDPCGVEGCPSLIGTAGTRGWCYAHYVRWKRYGDPTFSPGRPRKTLADRFWPKVDKRGPDECWPWIGHIKRNGYGAITLGGKAGKIEMAHRAAYILTHGEIPEGLVIDHKCRVRHCVNVAHMQLVTQALNAQNRGPSRGSVSGVRNVAWHTGNEQWVVRMVVDGRTYYGGYFDTIAEADAAAIALRNRLMTNNLPDRAA